MYKEKYTRWLHSEVVDEKTKEELRNLPEKEIEDMMDELVKTDGDGSKTKLNALLSTYGVNYDILRDIYLMQEKITAWKDYKYGKNAEQLGQNVKNE